MSHTRLFGARQAGLLVPGDFGDARNAAVRLPSGCSNAAVAVARHWTRHMGAASEREKEYSSSGTVNSTRAFLGKR